MGWFKGKPVIDGQRQPLGYQQLTSLGSATGLTPPTGASFVIIAISGQTVRWRDDGTNPTSTVGMPEADGAVFAYTGDMSTITFIEQVAGAIINVSYYA